ncbi:MULTISPECIES: hypothetical protein [Lysinibacillus]|uniref:hypothetical protein n=1 Tax=Lysinibacillus TaxID=400634 RepID=UPI0005658C21|nr:hypothetical protein [Lysinibacillus sphaericus]PIJ98648.1 hypothetical protein CTN02_08210 [Lysinibacillus sphaericus]QTB22379.1 hypothetical protein J1907_22550 [Lysinibacillus sphaericus]UZM99437.1 hypothetical protein OL548_03530 [Lysinibacillus sp. MHQ-1]
MNFVINSNFKELDFTELLAFDGGGYWTGFSATVIGGAEIEVRLGAGGVDGIVGGLIYVF